MEKKCLHSQKQHPRRQKTGGTDGPERPLRSALPLWGQLCPPGQPRARLGSAQQLPGACQEGGLPGASGTPSQPPLHGVTSHIIPRAAAFITPAADSSMAAGGHASRGCPHLSRHFLQSAPFPPGLGITNHTLPLRSLSDSLAACRHCVLTSILTHSASVEVPLILFLYACKSFLDTCSVVT